MKPLFAFVQKTGLPKGVLYRVSIRGGAYDRTKPLNGEHPEFINRYSGLLIERYRMNGEEVAVDKVYSAKNFWRTATRQYASEVYFERHGWYAIEADGYRRMDP
jgi:hypothetical protein